MKKNTKKSTNKKLSSAVAKNKEASTKKLGNTVVKGKKAAKIQKQVIVAAQRKAVAAKKKAAKTRNSFRRALYRANKIIKSGNSLYKNELSMKDFKKEYEDFGKRTGKLKGKNLDEGLKTFLGNQINSRTPKQCESAVDNLMKHLNDAVSALNKLEGDIDLEGDIKGLSNTNNKYIKVLEEIGALKTKKNEEGKDIYSIIEEKLPDSEDLRAVSNKYLNVKRTIIRYFGNQEYSEAYGS